METHIIFVHPLQYMAKSGAVNAVIDVLKQSGVEAVVFDGAVPNPTDKNVSGS